MHNTGVQEGLLLSLLMWTYVGGEESPASSQTFHHTDGTKTANIHMSTLGVIQCSIVERAPDVAEVNGTYQ